MKFKTSIAILALAMAGQSYAGCDAMTIEGTYAAQGLMDIYGVDPDTTESNMVFQIGRFEFDGNRIVRIRDGRMVLAGLVISMTGAGSYTVTSRCSGRASVKLTLKIPDQTPISAKIRYDFVLSGSHDNPRIHATYNQDGLGNPGESGLIEMIKADF
jgi:hypothetical protein